MPDKVDPSEIPAVQEFLAVQQELENFKAQHAATFEAFEIIVNEYNEKLSAAEQKVRARGVTCGPFNAYQTQAKYDANALYEMMGREKFLELGGKETIQKVRTLDKGIVDSHISSGNIPEEVANEVKKTTPRYKKPSEVKL